MRVALRSPWLSERSRRVAEFSVVLPFGFCSPNDRGKTLRVDPPWIAVEQKQTPQVVEKLGSGNKSKEPSA